MYLPSITCSELQNTEVMEMIRKGTKVRVICSKERLKEVGILQKHIKHILGKWGTVQEVKLMPESDDVYLYFVSFRYVKLKPAQGNRTPYYVFIEDMIEPLEVKMKGTAEFADQPGVEYGA